MSIDTIDYLPSSFSKFVKPIKILETYNPQSIAIVGSFGDITKTPTEFSDIDLIFVFNTNAITVILSDYLESLAKINKLIAIYLGVTSQFGHTISMYFKNNPLCWVDIGIMDSNFASNYLVNLPIKIVKGNIPTSGIPSFPTNQMHHLAKGIIKAHNQNNKQKVLISCHRYLRWWKIHIDTLLRMKNYDISKHRLKSYEIEYKSYEDSEISKFYYKYRSASKYRDIIKVVLSDIKNNFPIVFNGIDSAKKNL
jgi:hypothetical protein